MSQQFLKFIQRGATAEVADAVAADTALLSWRDANGVSALMWSIYSGQPLIRDFFLSEKTQTGDPLDFFEASAVGDVAQLEKTSGDIASLVVEHSGDGWTPLHLAAAFGSPEAVRWLLDHGAPVDVVSNNAQRNHPLHAALALGRNPDTIRMLLEAGADPNARQAGGYTAIFSAAAANRRDLAELLIVHGAHAAQHNDFGQTAAGYARERSHPELADWLDSLPPAAEPAQ
jgi:hypothetical protein